MKSEQKRMLWMQRNINDNYLHEKVLPHMLQAKNNSILVILLSHDDKFSMFMSFLISSCFSSISMHVQHKKNFLLYSLHGKFITTFLNISFTYSPFIFSHKAKKKVWWFNLKDKKLHHQQTYTHVYLTE